jgi:hypothetical protein
MRKHERESLKVNVWCILMHDCIIGPLCVCARVRARACVHACIERTVTMNMYMDMLEQSVLPQLQELQLNMVFQRDGGFSSVSSETFSCWPFPGCGVGGDGPVAWPLQSPNLTPLNVLLWCYVKGVVYTNPVTDLQDLHNRITNSISMITPDLLEDPQIGINYRSDSVCAMRCSL